MKRIFCFIFALSILLTTFSGVTLPVAQAAQSPIAHSYVRSGLFAWYSGEHNTLNGYNADSAVWQDLIGNRDMTITKNADNYFTVDGLHVKSAKHAFPKDIVELINGVAFTVEIEFGQFTSVGNYFNTFMNSSNDHFSLFRRNANNTIEWKFGGGSVRPIASNALNNLNNHLLTVTYKYGDAAIMYIDGKEVSRTECELYMGADDLFIGHTDSLKDVEAVYKNIRFYTRALSQSEVLHNAAADGYADIAQTYVKDGLVSLYSGISNTENGYDPNASVWTDLIGSNHLTITKNANNYFNPQGLRVTGADTSVHSFPQSIVNLINGNAFTVEIHLGDFNPVGSAYGTFMNSSNDNFALFRQVSTDQISFKFAGNSSTERPFIQDALNLLDNGVISITYKVGGKCSVYVDGQLMAQVNCTKAMGANDLFIGQRNNVKTFDSTYRCIRFYNRELTAEEVYANATADGVTSVADAASDNPGYVTVAQPQTNIIGDIAAIRYVNSQSELEALMAGDALPATAMFDIDSQLRVLDSNGDAFSTVSDVLLATQFKVLCCFNVSDKMTADVLSEFLMGIRFYDVQLISDDKEVLKYAREKMPNCYGILDLRKEYANVTDLTEDQLLDIRRAVKAYNASVAVLNVKQCNNNDVQYLYDRQVNVWAWASDNPSSKEQYYALLSGAIGVVSDATDKLLDIACNKLEKNTMTRMPINIGHRGIPSKAPENCIEGAMYAYELGAQVIEIDVYLTKDDKAVLMHDPTTGRTCNKDLTVAQSTLAELTALYCNKGFENNQRFKNAKVPSLDDFLAAFKGTDVRFYIELKSGGDKIATIVKDLVEKNDMYGQCSVISFYPEIHASFRKIYPEMSLGGLCSSYMNGDDPESDFRAAMSYIGKNNTTLNPRYSANGSTTNYDYSADDLRTALIRGIQIHPWTFAGRTTAYRKHFLWGYSGLTGDNADALADITCNVALADNISFVLGRVTGIDQVVKTYVRNTSVNSNVSVTVLEGNATVSGNKLTPTAQNDITFITYSTHKITTESFTRYTQPVTLSVALDTTPSNSQAPTPTVTQGAQSTVAPTVSDNTTNPPQNTATNAPQSTATESATDAPSVTAPTQETSSPAVNTTEPAQTQPAATSPQGTSSAQPEDSGNNTVTIVIAVAAILLLGIVITGIVIMKKK